jgi:hypothetical protein
MDIRSLRNGDVYMNESKKNKKTEIANDVALGANSEMLGRYSEAGKQFKVAYDGIDNATGQELHQGLKKISQRKINPDCQNININQQAGYSAEVIDTANQNAENIKKGNTNRVYRTDDLGRFNDTKADQVALDELGNVVKGSEVQMKFLGYDAKGNLEFVNEVSGSEYAGRYPDGKFRVPSDQYNAIKAELQKKISKLEEKPLTPEEQRKLEYLKKVDKNLKKSTVSKKEAVDTRLNPEKATTKQILKTSNEAGLAAAQIGAAVGGGFSIIANTIAVLKGEKEVEDAIFDTIGDTAKAGAIGYATGFTNTAFASVMKNSSDTLVRSLGKANAPAYVIQTAITTTKSLVSLCKGDITVNDFFLEIGKNGTLLLASAQGAIIGQVLIPVPVPVVGALVGGLVSTLICGAIYDYTIGMKLLNAEIDAFCDQLGFEISLLKEYQTRLMQLDLNKFKRDTGSYKIIADYISGEYNEQDFNVMLKLTYNYIGIPCPWGEGLFDDFMQDKNKVLTFG